MESIPSSPPCPFRTPQLGQHHKEDLLQADIHIPAGICNALIETMESLHGVDPSIHAIGAVIVIAAVLPFALATTAMRRISNSTAHLCDADDGVNASALSKVENFDDGFVIYPSLSSGRRRGPLIIKSSSLVEERVSTFDQGRLESSKMGKAVAACLESTWTLAEYGASFVSIPDRLCLLPREHHGKHA